MRLISRILLSVLVIGCALLGAQETVKTLSNNQSVEINFRDLEVTDFVRLVSNILNKNVLLQDAIPGKVEFSSTAPVDKKDLTLILQSVLASKGYTMVDHGKYLEVVRNRDAAQYNLPVLSYGADKYTQMVTQIVPIKGSNVDEVAAKIRHLASLAAKISTIRESNTLIITDFPKNIDTIKKVLSLIEKNSESEVIFIKLQQVDIEQIFPILQSISKDIFNEKVESERVSIYQNTADNGIIAVGPAENIAKLKDVISNLDKEQQSMQISARVIHLNNTEAKEIHKVISELLSSNQLTIAGNVTAKVAADANKPILSLDEASNSIIVLASQRDFEIIKGIVNELDQEQKQVFVKARIVEISESASQRVGLKYGLEGGRANSDGLYTFAMNMGGPSFALSSILSSAIEIGNIKSGLAFGAAIDFLRTNGAANIVSEPSVLCLNNMESKIYVGQTQSIITSATNSDSTTDLTRNTYSREDIGLTLQVKPRISNDGKVSLQIEAKVEDVIDGSGGESGMPTTTKREVTTRAIVKHGESVIVGGLIRNKKTENDSKVPLLGDIPLLGRLFTHTADIDDQLNIVIVLTPYIVNSSDDLSALRSQLVELDMIQEAYSKELEAELARQAAVAEEEAKKEKEKVKKETKPEARQDNTPTVGSSDYWNKLLKR
ncbi:MAG: type II secretion system secretin GspD [Campylobacteraceae bacterium]|jgi:general secretion pathway protein D|nr:type II secretion system secretin GspD [Campylobacteraceae bacterium]